MRRIIMSIAQALVSGRLQSARKLRRFARDDQGIITLESIIILPILIFAMIASFTFFDVFRKQSLALKANYAVADYLSRVESYDKVTIAGLDVLFRYISGSDRGNWLRISVIECRATTAQCNDENNRKLVYNMRNSHMSANVAGIIRYTQAEWYGKIGHHIPLMYQGQTLVVLETSAQYQPVLPSVWTGIGARALRNTVVTPPRAFAGLCFYNAPYSLCD